MTYNDHNKEKSNIIFKNIKGLNKRNIYYSILRPLLVNKYKDFFYDALNYYTIDSNISNKGYYPYECSAIINNIRKDLLELLINKWIACNHLQKFKNISIFITDKFLRAIPFLYNNVIVVMYSKLNDYINDLISGFINNFFLSTHFNRDKGKYVSYYNDIIVYCTNYKNKSFIYANDEYIIKNIKNISNIDNINDFLIEYNYYYQEYGGFTMLFNKDNDKISYSKYLLDSPNNDLYYFTLYRD